VLLALRTMGGESEAAWRGLPNSFKKETFG